MSAAELMADLARLGIRLEARGGRLGYAPRSALTPELIERLRSHKAELLAVLRGDAALWAEPVGYLADDWAGGVLWPVPTRPPTPISWEPRVVPAGECPRCRRREYRDAKIHEGRSVRRDCARCGRFIGFPVWYRTRDERPGRPPTSGGYRVHRTVKDVKRAPGCPLGTQSHKAAPRTLLDKKASIGRIREWRSENQES